MATTRRLHEALSGRRLTRLEYEHALPKLQDALLDAQFTLRQAGKHAVVLIVTGIPAAGRSEVVNELLGWLDPKLATVYGFHAPNDVERERPTLWRYWRLMPPKGRIAILHGGWYQDLLLGAAGLGAKTASSPAQLRRGRRARAAAGADAGAGRRGVVQGAPARRARDAAEASRQAAGEQDHALARDAGGSLAGAQLPARRARASSARWPPPSSPSRRGTSWTARTGSIARSRSGASCWPRSQHADDADPLAPETAPKSAAAAARRTLDSRRNRRVTRPATTSTTRSSSGCRAGSRCCRGASASSATRSSSRSKAWMPPARAGRSVVSRPRSMRASSASCRSRPRRPRNSRGPTSGASGSTCRRAAITRFSIAAGTGACWSSGCGASRRRPTGSAPMTRSTSSSASSPSTA